jgi:aspartate racemase
MTLGIIGGIGPESTIEYYRQLQAAWRAKRPDGSAPAILINSIDVNKMLGMIAAGKLAEVTGYLASEVERLEHAGADFGLLAANTPHVVFDEIRQRVSLSILSIVEATRDEARTRGLGRLGLFGTRFTMQGQFYPQVFMRAGLTIVAPTADEQDFIHGIYMGELLRSVFLAETSERLLEIVDRMRERDGIDGLILGGTELPFVLQDGARPALPFLDTTRIHVNAAVARLLSQN